MRRCAVLAGWVLFCTWTLVEPVRAEVALRLTPAETTPGTEVRVSWQADEATGVFLSGFGAVETSGSRTFQAKQSQTFVLVAEGPAGIRMASEHLEVRGGKGEDSLPRPADFRSPLRQRLTVVTVDSFTALCDRIQDVLQDELKFTVTAYQIPREKFVFLTEPSIRPGLVLPDDKKEKIRERRLAYLIEISLPGALPAEVQVTIQTWMQFRKIIKETWQTEGNAELHRQEAERLRQRIIAASAQRRQP